MKIFKIAIIVLAFFVCAILVMAINYTIYNRNLIVSGGNVTADYFFGIYNWIVGTSSSNYLSFNGTQLNFNETKLNLTIQNYDKSGKLLNYTPITTTGNITNGTLKGYLAATAICNSYYPGTHMCQISEIINHIQMNYSLANFTATFRASEGAPGYLAEANDCGAWQSASGSALGSIWVADNEDGGSGSLVACNAQRAIGCCI